MHPICLCKVCVCPGDPRLWFPGGGAPIILRRCIRDDHSLCCGLQDLHPVLIIEHELLRLPSQGAEPLQPTPESVPRDGP